VATLRVREFQKPSARRRHRDMSDLMDDKLVATHDWRNWHLAKSPGRPGHGGGGGRGEAGPGQAPGHAGRGPMNQQIRQIQAVDGASAPQVCGRLILTAVMSARGGPSGFVRDRVLPFEQGLRALHDRDIDHLAGRWRMSPRPSAAACRRAS